MKEKKSRHEGETDLMGLLVIHERGLCTLYKVFAKRFPEFADFWMALSDEEKGHALMLRDLKTRSSQQEAADYQKRLSSEAVETSLEFLRNEIRQAERISDPIEALAVAYNFETATVERKFFEIFSGEGKSVTSTLSHLTEVTEEHANRIREKRLEALAAASEKKAGSGS